MIITCTIICINRCSLTHFLISLGFAARYNGVAATLSEPLWSLPSGRHRIPRDPGAQTCDACFVSVMLKSVRHGWIIDGDSENEPPNIAQRPVICSL